MKLNPAEQEFQTGRSWQDSCILDDRNKKPIPNLANTMLALRGDPP
jgi:hypothetical protein